MLSRSEATSVAIAALAVASFEPVLSPLVVSTCTRCNRSCMVLSAESVWSSRAVASVMLRACWASDARPERVCIDLLVSVGESDGLVRTLPVLSWSWYLVRAARLLLIPVRLLAVSACWVIRIRSQPHAAGAVDQGVEDLVHRGDHAGSRLVAVLEGQHLGHLLVDAHPGHRLPGGVDVARDGGL